MLILWKYLKKHGKDREGEVSIPAIFHSKKHKNSMLSRITLRQDNVKSAKLKLPPCWKLECWCFAKCFQFSRQIYTYPEYKRFTLRSALRSSFKSCRLQTNRSSLPLIQHSMFQLQSAQKKGITHFWAALNKIKYLDGTQWQREDKVQILLKVRLHHKWENIYE